MSEFREAKAALEALCPPADSCLRPALWTLLQQQEDGNSLTRNIARLLETSEDMQRQVLDLERKFNWGKMRERCEVRRELDESLEKWGFKSVGQLEEQGEMRQKRGEREIPEKNHLNLGKTGKEWREVGKKKIPHREKSFELGITQEGMKERK